MNESYSMRVRENGIVIFRLADLPRRVVDLWMDDLARLGKAWIDGEMVALMIDMRGGGVPTPYAISRLREVSRATPAAARIRTAFLFDLGPAMTVAQLHLGSMGRLLGEKRAFSDEDAAFAWLSDVL